VPAMCWATDWSLSRAIERVNLPVQLYVMFNLVRRYFVSKQRYNKERKTDLGRSDDDIEEIRDLVYQSGQRTSK